MILFSKLLFTFFLFLAGDFVIWRKLREEFADEEIFSFSFWLVMAIVVGIVIGNLAESGKWGNGMTVWAAASGSIGLCAVWCRRHNWSIWDLADVLVPIGYWVWLVSALVFGWGRNVTMIVFPILGMPLLAYVKRNFRRFSWYRSGKPGLVGLAGLGWYAVAEIAVAFFNNSGIYWWGLKPGQFVCAWMLSFVMVAVYVRSGRRVKEDFGWVIKSKNGKKEIQ